MKRDFTFFLDQITNNNILELFEELPKYHKLNRRNNNLFLNLKRRYNAVKESELLGSVNKSELDVEINKITQGAIELVYSIERSKREIESYETINKLNYHTKPINQATWSKCGRYLATSSNDNSVKVWNTEYNNLELSLINHPSGVVCSSWHPNSEIIITGALDSTIRVWNIKGKILKIIQVHSESITNLKVVPKAKLLFSTGNDKKVTCISLDNWSTVWSLAINYGNPMAIEFDSKTNILIVGTDKGKIVFIDIKNGNVQSVLDAHPKEINDLAINKSRNILATASSDKTIKIFDLSTFKELIQLEGYTESVLSVSFSSDSLFLATKSIDQIFRIWRCDIWDVVLTMKDRYRVRYTNFGKINFHPYKSILPVLSKKNTNIELIELDFNLLKDVKPIINSIHYSNAKVALLGNSGVGKTKLGHRLAEGIWHPDDKSTHGMIVWNISPSPDKDVMLWDFAGQPEYRIIHQIFLNQVNIALILYDPTKSEDNFEGVEFWEKALDNTNEGEYKKILVASRVDVGRERFLKNEIQEYCKRNNYIDSIATSAFTNEGCEELFDKVNFNIDWSKLPQTSSPEIFKLVKDYLKEIRKENRIEIMLVKFQYSCVHVHARHH